MSTEELGYEAGGNGPGEFEQVWKITYAPRYAKQARYIEHSTPNGIKRRSLRLEFPAGVSPEQFAVENIKRRTEVASAIAAVLAPQIERGDLLLFVPTYTVGELELYGSSLSDVVLGSILQTEHVTGVSTGGFEISLAQAPDEA